LKAARDHPLRGTAAAAAAAARHRRRRPLSLTSPSPQPKPDRETKVRRLAMYRTRAVRDKKGRVLHEAYQSKELPSTRIQPDRRWFGNTRVVGARQLEAFREEMASKVGDGYTVLLRQKKLPLQLLEDPEKGVVGGRDRRGGPDAAAGSVAAPGASPAPAALSSGGAILDGSQKAAARAARQGLLAVMPFSDTFGRGAKRKRPKIAADAYEALAGGAERAQQEFGARGIDIPAPGAAGAAGALTTTDDGTLAAGSSGGKRHWVARDARDPFAAAAAAINAAGGAAEGDANAAAAAAAAYAGADASDPFNLDALPDARRDPVFEKGQSKRIWGELYKVLDSSDVVIQVLDARDPEGTRSRFLERHLRRSAQCHKHMILLLNKCDLVSFVFLLFFLRVWGFCFARGRAFFARCALLVPAPAPPPVVFSASCPFAR
jgi:nuclear GTP-binding protein